MKENGRSLGDDGWFPFRYKLETMDIWEIILSLFMYIIIGSVRKPINAINDDEDIIIIIATFIPIIPEVIAIIWMLIESKKYCNEHQEEYYKYCHDRLINDNWY